MSAAHLSVLINEVLNVFKELQLHTFVDCTLGAGGHAEAILAAHPEIERFIGIDQDPYASEIAKKRLGRWEEKVTFLSTNFRNLSVSLKEIGIHSIDGLMMDLGVSSMQLDLPEKGFSFMQEGPLDMRMDPRNPLKAEIIVNEWPEAEIGKILRDYGEEKQWKSAARAIVTARQKKPIRTTKELAQVLFPVLMHRAKKGINPLTLVFQGLRIFVNDELESLKEVLPQSLNLLKPGGRMAVISFHSLEDRIAKQFFQYEADDKESTSGIGGVFLDKKPRINILTRKPIVPTELELEQNARSRSAKLRAAEKL